MRLRISSPATSANLGAGFDSLGLALDICNEFEVISSSLKSVHISGYGAGAKALKVNNSFINIFKSTLKMLGCHDENYSFRLHNAIPLSRGMGSSSSVIIAAIAGAFAWAGREVDMAEVLELSLAYEPHTDNTAPCALGGFVISAGCKAAARFELAPNLRAVIAVPHERISTAASRAALREQVGLKDACFNLAASAQISAAFASGRYELLRAAWGDRLHQSQRMRALSGVYQGIFAALAGANLLSREQVAQAFGAEFAATMGAGSERKELYFAALSGSGSSFLLLCDESLADAAAAALAGCGLEAVYNLRMQNAGVCLNLS